jgi:small conductance mechanosensitive channel
MRPTCLARWVVPVFLVLGLVVRPLEAEDVKAPEPQAITADDPMVKSEILAHRVKPLTQKELVAEAAAWQDLLKAKVFEISEAEIESMTAKGDRKTALGEKLVTLREERTRIADRLRIVLNELVAKGGEIDEQQAYLDNVTGVEIDATDVSGTWLTTKGWLLSEEGGQRWGFNILKFLLTLAAFVIIAKIAAGVTSRALNHSRIETSDLLKKFIVNSVRRVVWFLGIVVALGMIEVNIGPFLAAMGVVGFVVGFALQDTLSNFAAGFMILLYRPYDVGDVVTAGGELGVVKDMSLVSTTLTTFDNQIVVVPNGSIWGNVIKNATGNETRRIDMTFGISYGDDIGKALGILEEIVTKHELVLAEPAPVIRMHELGDSSVNFICRPWSKTSDYWAVYWDVHRAVKEKFDAEGVSIPFPQRDVHLIRDSAEG